MAQKGMIVIMMAIAAFLAVIGLATITLPGKETAGGIIIISAVVVALITLFYPKQDKEKNH